MSKPSTAQRRILTTLSRGGSLCLVRYVTGSRFELWPASGPPDVVSRPTVLAMRRAGLIRVHHRDGATVFFEAGAAGTKGRPDGE